MFIRTLAALAVASATVVPAFAESGDGFPSHSRYMASQEVGPQKVVRAGDVMQNKELNGAGLNADDRIVVSEFSADPHTMYHMSAGSDRD